MRIINCAVILGDGEVLHTVPKQRVTELELRILRVIHGGDRITNIQHIGDIHATEQSEHLELAKKYGRKIVEDTFGVELIGFDDWLNAKLDQREVERTEREQFGYPDFDKLERERKEALAKFLTQTEAPAATIPTAVAATEAAMAAASEFVEDDDAEDAPAFDGNGDPVQAVAEAEADPAPAPEEVQQSVDKEVKPQASIDLE